MGAPRRPRAAAPLPSRAPARAPCPVPKRAKASARSASGIAQVGTEQPSTAQRSSESPAPVRLSSVALTSRCTGCAGPHIARGDRRPWRRRRTETPRACPSNCCAARSAAAAAARQRLRRRLMHRPMRAAFQRAGIEPGARQHAGGGRDMAGLAAMRRAGERELLLGETEAIGGARLDQHQRLQRLDRRARIDRPLDVAERKHASPIGIDHRDTRRDGGFRPARRARLRREPDYPLVNVAAVPNVSATVQSETTYNSHWHTRPCIMQYSGNDHASQDHLARIPRPVSAADRGPRRALSRSRTGRAAGATPTGRAPAACRRRPPIPRRAFWSCPAAPAG